MEYATAKRLRPIGADQHIDAEALFKIFRWPNPLNHHDVPLQTVKDFYRQHDAAEVVAQPHAVPIA